MISDLNEGKDEFLRAYRKYLVSLGDSIPCSELMDAVKKYGHIASAWQSDIWEIWSKYSVCIDESQCFQMTSNGSTKLELSKYLWGPNFSRLQSCLWHFCHRQWPHTKFRLYLRNWKGRFFLDTRHMSFGRVWCVDPDIGQKLWNNESVASTDTIKTHLMNRLRNITLISPPMALFSFLHYDWFREFLRQRVKLISLTETDASVTLPAIKEIGVPVVNQMCSWREGTSFYTCPHGKMHFLDFLFAVDGDKIIDFLNMAPDRGKSGNPDKLEVAGPLEQCQCGTMYRPYKFHWHAMKSIVDRDGRPMDPTEPSYILTGAIRNLSFFQLIQQKDPAYFVVHADREPERMDIVKKFCALIYKDQVRIDLCTEPFQIGRKFPVFWSLVN